MCAARRDGYGGYPRREQPRRREYPSGRGGSRRGGHPSPGGGQRGPSRGGQAQRGRRPSNPPIPNADPRARAAENVPDARDHDSDDEGASKENLSMVAGILYMLMAIYLFFMFFWRDGGREFLMFEFAIILIVISIIAVFLALSHDLKFMPSKVSIYWTNFVSGILTMIILIMFIKIFKDFSTGKYDLFDNFNVIISVALGGGATYLLLHSMFFEKKEPYVQDRVPIAFMSGIGWAGLGGFFYYLFIDEPYTRYEDAPEIFWIALVIVIIASMAVFFNLLGNTYFAPKWATKKHMNFFSGILLGVILFITLITALMFNEAPYEIWDTVRVMAAGGIASYAMATAVFSTGM